MMFANTIVEQFVVLSSNRKILYELSRNAKNTIFRTFSPSVYVDSLNQLYQNI